MTAVRTTFAAARCLPWHRAFAALLPQGVAVVGFHPPGFPVPRFYLAVGEVVMAVRYAKTDHFLVEPVGRAWRDPIPPTARYFSLGEDEVTVESIVQRAAAAALEVAAAVRASAATKVA